MTTEVLETDVDVEEVDVEDVWVDQVELDLQARMARCTHVPCHGHAAAHRVYVPAAASGCLPSHPAGHHPGACHGAGGAPAGGLGRCHLARWKCECPFTPPEARVAHRPHSANA